MKNLTLILRLTFAEIANDIHVAKLKNRLDAYTCRALSKWIVNKEFLEYDATLKEVSDHFGVTSEQLNEFCKHYTGMSYMRFRITHMVREAKRLLLVYPDASLLTIANNLGYYDHTSFTRTFTAQVGMGPDAWRKKHRFSPLKILALIRFACRKRDLSIFARENRVLADGSDHLKNL